MREGVGVLRSLLASRMLARLCVRHCRARHALRLTLVSFFFFPSSATGVTSTQTRSPYEKGTRAGVSVRVVVHLAEEGGVRRWREWWRRRRLQRANDGGGDPCGDCNRCS